MKYPPTLGRCKPRLAALPYESSALGGRPGRARGIHRSVPHSGRGSPSVVLWWEWSDRQRPSPRVGGSVAVFFLSVAIAEEAVVADTVEAVGQYVEQKAANELIGRQGHSFLLVVIAIVLVAELHLTIFNIQQAVVGDGDAVSVASHVV